MYNVSHSVLVLMDPSDTTASVFWHAIFFIITFFKERDGRKNILDSKFS